jgi:hypothetical protein
LCTRKQSVFLINIKIIKRPRHHQSNLLIKKKKKKKKPENTQIPLVASFNFFLFLRVLKSLCYSLKILKDQMDLEQLVNYKEKNSMKRHKYP